MAMVLPWTRQRLQLQKRRETDEQLASVGDQLLEVGEIIGRLNAVADRFETVAARIVSVMDEEEQDGNGNHAGPQQ